MGNGGHAVGALAILLAACGRIAFDVNDPNPTPDATPLDATTQLQWRLTEVAETTGNFQLPLQPTAAGDLVVVALNLSNGTILSLTDNAGSSYVAIPQARATNVGSLEFWYAAGAGAGASTLSVMTSSGQPPVAIVAWVVGNMRTANALDTATASNNQPASTTPRGPAITTSATGEFVVSAVKAVVVNDTSAGNSFTNDSSASTDGYAHLADPRAPAATYQAQWDASNATYCGIAAAFFVGP